MSVTALVPGFLVASVDAIVQSEPRVFLERSALLRGFGPPLAADQTVVVQTDLFDENLDPLGSCCLRWTTTTLEQVSEDSSPRK